MVDITNSNDEVVEPRQSERFLDVFVIRSFRESHMRVL